MNVEDVYPYHVYYPRTVSSEWYSPSGTWYQLSTWCNEAFGVGKWEYYFNEFRFLNESDLMLFMLKWINK